MRVTKPNMKYDIHTRKCFISINVLICPYNLIYIYMLSIYVYIYYIYIYVSIYYICIYIAVKSEDNIQFCQDDQKQILESKS